MKLMKLLLLGMLCMLISIVSVAAQTVSPVAADIQPEPSFGTGDVEFTMYLGINDPFSVIFVEGTLGDLLNTYGEELTVTMSHYPLPIHSDSMELAELGECVLAYAGEEAYWEYVEDTMQDSDDITLQSALLIANRLGNSTSVNVCLKSGQMKAEVLHDRETAEAEGLTGTPMFTIIKRTETGIFERTVNGAQPFGTFATVIEEAIAFEGAIVVEEEPTPNIIEDTIQIREGWNLIPAGHGINLNFVGSYSDEFILAAYVWDPYNQEYADLFEGDDQVIEDLLDNLGYTSFWIYSTEDGELEIEIDIIEVQENLERVIENQGEFEEGWNFYVVLPQMIDQFEGPLFRIYPNDNSGHWAGKIYAWDFLRDGWETGTYEGDIVGGDDDDIIGLPILLYYEDEYFCSFEQSYEVPAFPQLN